VSREQWKKRSTLFLTLLTFPLFYVHDIFVEDELFKNKGNTIKAGSAGIPVGESSKSIAYIKRILHNIIIVKQTI